MKKNLSIIIPTYNMEAFLPRCLNSLIVNERLESLEIWVVNDGSKDKSSYIGHQYENKYPGVINVIDKTNGNYGSCINAALPKCTGKYVKILDSDDYFDSSSLKELINELEKCEEDIILTNYTKIYSNSKNIIKFNLSNKYVYDLEVEIPPIYSMHAIIYKRELFDKFNYKQTEGISYTDQEWIFYPYFYSKKLKYIDINLYQYNLDREGQTMEESVLKKNIGMIAGLILNFIDFIKNKSELLTHSQRDFYRNLIYPQLSLFYKTELLFIRKKDMIINTIGEIESKLELIDPELFRRIECENYHGIYYIKMFRNNIILPTIVRKLLMAPKNIKNLH